MSVEVHEIGRGFKKTWQDIHLGGGIGKAGVTSQIGDFGSAPVLSRVSTDINFRAMGGLPAIVELLTIL